MMNKCQKINLQEPQRNRNATANFVNLIRTSAVWIKTNGRVFSALRIEQDTQSPLSFICRDSISQPNVTL